MFILKIAYNAFWFVLMSFSAWFTIVAIVSMTLGMTRTGFALCLLLYAMVLAYIGWWAIGAVRKQREAEQRHWLAQEKLKEQEWQEGQRQNQIRDRSFSLADIDGDIEQTLRQRKREGV